MNPIDIIEKKRQFKELTQEEIMYFFKGFLNGEIPDYQMAALLMAITINGMTTSEAIELTRVFVDSGITLDLSSIEGIKVDKHSTGGVGDKTTFVIAPVLASCGLKVCKMSGRGLGFTGGTIDKLESIPGIKVSLSKEKILEELNKVGMVIASQSSDLAPLDRVIYALRDVTGTVSSLPLIASSIMSKKIALGTDYIFIDLKVGKGALIKTQTEGEMLKELMEQIALFYNKKVDVELTGMDEPLGYTVGNALEVMEAMEVLKGNIHNKFTALCSNIIISILMKTKNITKEEAINISSHVIKNGDSYRKFEEFVKFQGGDLTKLRVASNLRIIKSPQDGFIKSIDALKIGHIVKNIGGGRIKKEDSILPGVGFYFFKESSDPVKKGENLCTLFYEDKDVNDNEILDAFTFTDTVVNEEEVKDIANEKGVFQGEAKDSISDQALVDTMKLIPNIINKEENMVNLNDIKINPSSSSDKNNLSIEQGVGGVEIVGESGKQPTTK